MNQEDQMGSNRDNVLKELSDIKSTLAVNTSETQNIKGSIAEIKEDIREIKNNGVTQEQHKELIGSIKEHEDRILSLENSKTSITVLLGVGTALLSLLASLLIYHIVH